MLVREYYVKSIKIIPGNDRDTRIDLRAQAILHNNLIQYVELLEYKIIVSTEINPLGGRFTYKTLTQEQQFHEEGAKGTTFKQWLKLSENKNIIKIEAITVANGKYRNKVCTIEELQYKVLSEMVTIYQTYINNKVILTVEKIQPLKIIKHKILYTKCDVKTTADTIKGVLYIISS